LAETEEVVRLREAGVETLAVEFKRGMSWNEPATKGKVIRAALALANLRDGGTLAFGLQKTEPNPRHEMVGMSDGDYQSFNQDDVAATVNAHATPYIDLTVRHFEHDGRKFVVITVRQFADYPVICSKDYVVDGRAVVIRGHMYCRSRRTIESTEIQSPEDLRQLIDLAIAKGIERYFALREIERRAEGPSARDRYRAQLGDLADEH
jgi:predicted HTH transcriptional regulator